MATFVSEKTPYFSWSVEQLQHRNSIWWFKYKSAVPAILYSHSDLLTAHAPLKFPRKFNYFTVTSDKLLLVTPWAGFGSAPGSVEVWSYRVNNGIVMVEFLRSISLSHVLNSFVATDSHFILEVREKLVQNYCHVFNLDVKEFTEPLLRIPREWKVRSSLLSPDLRRYVVIYGEHADCYDTSVIAKHTILPFRVRITFFGHDVISRLNVWSLLNNYLIACHPFSHDSYFRTYSLRTGLHVPRLEMQLQTHTSVLYAREGVSNCFIKVDEKSHEPMQEILRLRILSHAMVFLCGTLHANSALRVAQSKPLWEPHLFRLVIQYSNLR